MQIDCHLGPLWSLNSWLQGKIQVNHSPKTTDTKIVNMLAKNINNKGFLNKLLLQNTECVTDLD